MGGHKNTIYELLQRSRYGVSRYPVHPAWDSLGSLPCVVSGGGEESRGRQFSQQGRPNTASPTCDVVAGGIGGSRTGRIRTSWCGRPKEFRHAKLHPRNYIVIPIRFAEPMADSAPHLQAN